jgi:hypothetical protein
MNDLGERAPNVLSRDLAGGFMSRRGWAVNSHLSHLVIIHGVRPSVMKTHTQPRAMAVLVRRFGSSDSSRGSLTFAGLVGTLMECSNQAVSLNFCSCEC